MSLSPKSQVMFASAFSWIGGFFRINGILIVYATATLLNIWICMQWTDAAEVVVGADWTLHPWHHNNVGVSLRARWDTTLVRLIIIVIMHVQWRDPKSCFQLFYSCSCIKQRLNTTVKLGSYIEQYPARWTTQSSYTSSPGRPVHSDTNSPSLGNVQSPCI